MNVLVLNEQQNQLQSIEVDIIKSVTGKFEASEIVNMFKDFFFNKMILDVTALKDYENPTTYKTIVDGINPDKVIFYLPEGSELCTSGFLSRLINFGIYNFTTNNDGVKYLIKKSNTLKDVESIIKMAQGVKQPEFNNQNNIQQSQPQIQEQRTTPVQNIQQPVQQTNSNYLPTDVGGQPMIIGFQNVTEHAGATSLIYMLKKELTEVYKNRVYAVEIDKNDFLSYGDKTMVSTTKEQVRTLLSKLGNCKVILVDLNNFTENDICTTTIYLMEPSTIKLNTLMRKNRNAVTILKGKDVILNQSLLTSKEISEFEYESGIKVLYNMPPLNDRKRNEIIIDFLKKIRLINDNSHNGGAGKIFGLFRK